MAEQQPVHHANDPLTAPPVQPGPLPIAQAQSKWPKVLGILAIVVGCISLLEAIWSIVDSMMPAAAATQPAEASVLPRNLEMIGDLVNAALATFLVFGGIRLLSRRVFAVRLLKTWAILDLISIAVGLVFTAAAMAQALQEMLQPTTGMSPVPKGVATAFAVGIIALALLAGVVPPVFTLVWFSRQKIKDEIASWV